MNARSARQILRTYRPSGEDDHERDVRAAVKFAEKQPELETEFRNQLAFDRALAARLEEKPLPEGFAAALEEAALRLEARRSRRFTMRDPAVIAIGFAFLILVGLLTWIFLGQMGSFAGMQEIAQMVSDGDNVGADRFTEIETKAGSLTDWFVMQDFDGFVVPRSLSGTPVVGVRLFQYDDISVATVAAEKPRAFFYVFDAHPLGLSLPEGRWRTAAYGPGRKRFFAVQQIGSMAFVVVLRESGEAALKKFLAATEAPR